MAIYNIYNKDYYICIYFDCFKYNIMLVYSSKYIKCMKVINFINLLNYLNRAMQFDVVLYLHVPGMLAKKSYVSIYCNCSNSIIAKNLKPITTTITFYMKSYL